MKAVAWSNNFHRVTNVSMYSNNHFLHIRIEQAVFERTCVQFLLMVDAIVFYWSFESRKANKGKSA